MVKKAKDEYVKSQLKINEKDPRKFWNLIQEVWTPNANNSGQIHLMDQLTGQKIEDNNVPMVFNEHLSRVGPALASKFSNAPPFISSVHSVLSQFAYVNIRDEEVADLVNKIQTHKSSAIEGLSSRIVKDSFSVLVRQLRYLFNISIETCTFPSDWRAANVVVLHKGQAKGDVNNYRPISLLPLPAKLMEALIHKRVYFYL